MPALWLMGARSARRLREIAGERWSGTSPRVAQRPRRGEVLAGLERRLQPREDHRPAAVELVVGAFAQLVVRDRQPARVLDRLDVPRDAGRALGLDVVAP